MEQAGSKSIGLIVQVILARMLSPEDFGVLAIMLVIVNIADSISQSGLGLALIQKSDAEDDSYSTALWLSLFFSFVLYGAIFVLAPVVSNFYDLDEISTYLRVIGVIIICNSANSIHRSYLQKRMEFKKLCIVSIVGVVVSGASGIIFAMLGAGIWALIIQSVVQSVMICLVMVAVVPWRPRLVFSGEKAASLYSYGWKVCATTILDVFYTGVSELVIGKTCNPVNLGYYSQGRKYPLATAGVISNSISNVLFPALSSIKGSKEEFLARIKMALSAGTFVVTPISFLLALTAKPLVALLLTEKWLPCVFIFQLTCIPYAFLIFQLVNLRAYMALGNSALYLRLQIIKVLLGGSAICGTAILTADVNMTAVATCLAGIFSILFIDLFPAKRELGYGGFSQLKDQAPVFLATLVASLATSTLFLFDLSYFFQLVSQVVVFVLVFLLVSYLSKAQGLRLIRHHVFKKE